MKITHTTPKINPRQETLFPQIESQSKSKSQARTDRFWEDLKSGRFASMVREAAANRNLSINSSLEAYHIMKPLMAEKDDVEQLWGIFLNAKNRIITIEKLSAGTLTCASVYPREVVKAMIEKKAAALVLAHNHPSNDPTPSPEDHQITVRVAIALKTIDAVLHDHIVVAGEKYQSMADLGFMQKATQAFNKIIST